MRTSAEPAQPHASITDRGINVAGTCVLVRRRRVHGRGLLVPARRRCGRVPTPSPGMPSRGATHRPEVRARRALGREAPSEVPMHAVAVGVGSTLLGDAQRLPLPAAARLTPVLHARRQGKAVGQAGVVSHCQHRAESSGRLPATGRRSTCPRQQPPLPAHGLTISVHTRGTGQRSAAAEAESDLPPARMQTSPLSHNLHISYYLLSPSPVPPLLSSRV